MLIDLFLIGIPLLWLGVASIIDIKTREVPDWISYSLVLLGLAIRGSYALLNHDLWFILKGFIALALAFGAGSIMYYTKQWGGGDSKLIMGIAVFFVTTPTLLGERIGIPFLAAFSINLVLIGALYGISYSLMLALRERKKVLNELRKKEHARYRYLWIPFAGVFVLTFLLVQDPLLKTLILLLVASLGLLLYLLHFTKVVERICMQKHIPVKNLREGDWLIHNIIHNGKTLVTAKNIGLEKEDIAKLRNSPIKNVLVKEGMPFVPVFFLTLLLTLISGPLLYTPALLATIKAFFFSA